MKELELQIPEILQSNSSQDNVIISISNNGKDFGSPKNGVSTDTAYYKKIAYTIISIIFRII